MASKNSVEKQVDMSKEQLIADFKVVMADAEALLKATANQGGEKIEALRAKAGESLRAANARLAEAQDAVVAKTRQAAKATDAYVHENPWQSVAAAGVAGLILGLLFNRR